MIVTTNYEEKIEAYIELQRNKDPIKENGLWH
jgi:hypothetical protein